MLKAKNKINLILVIALLFNFCTVFAEFASKDEMKIFDEDLETFANVDQYRCSVKLDFTNNNIYALNVFLRDLDYPKKITLTDKDENIIYHNENGSTTVTSFITPMGSKTSKLTITFVPQNINNCYITFEDFNSNEPFIREIEPISITGNKDIKINNIPNQLYKPLVNYPVAESMKNHSLYDDINYVSVTGLMKITAPDDVCDKKIFDAAVDKLAINGKEVFTSQFSNSTTQAQAAKLLHSITRLKKDGPIIMFQIDEGIGNGGIHKMYQNDLDKLYKYIQNSYEAILPLTIKYNVAVQIYPHLNYNATPTEPIDRIDSALKQTLQFFEDKKDITVYLEIFSSGIGLLYPNGGYSTMLMAPLYGNTGEKPRKALSMDVNTLKALKLKYPNAFEGVRFHEMFGGIIRAINIPEDVKARPFEPDIFKAIIDTCKEVGLKLDWGDSSWFASKPSVANDTYPALTPAKLGNEHKSLYTNEPFNSMFEYARNTLGKDVCFNWSNNNWHFTVNLGFFDSKISYSKKDVAVPAKGYAFVDLPFKDLPFKNWTNSSWGISNQSWFWYENIRNTIGIYYRYGQYAEPIEILTAFTNKGIKEGAKTVQYEPVEYLFNSDNPSFIHSQGKTNSLVYDTVPDGSAKMVLKRHIQQLLDIDNPYSPPADIGRIFDKNQQRFLENDISEPPLNYYQTTVGIVGNDYGNYDFYNYGGRWLRQDYYRQQNEVYKADKIIRIDIQGDGLDEIIAVNYRNDGAELSIYSHFGSRYGKYKIEGNIVDITSANVSDDIVGEGDNDELLIAVKNGDNIEFEVYQITQISSWMDHITFAKQTVNEVNKYLKIPKHKGDFIQMASVRTDNILYTNKLKTVDKIAVLTTDGLYLDDKFVPLTGVNMVTADVNVDRKDEILILNKDVITVYEFLSDTILPIEKQKIDHKNVKTMFSQRRGVPVFSKGKPESELWLKGKEVNGFIYRANMNVKPTGTNLAGNAIDGSFDTWAQSSTDTPWDLTIDLGQPTEIHKVKLDLGTKFYAEKFDLQVSDDLKNWKTVASENKGGGKTKTYTFDKITCKYFKLNVIKSNGGGGHSVREITFLHN